MIWNCSANSIFFRKSKIDSYVALFQFWPPGLKPGHLTDWPPCRISNRLYVGTYWIILYVPFVLVLCRNWIWESDVVPLPLIVNCNFCGILNGQWKLRNSRLHVSVVNMLAGCHVRCLMFAYVMPEGSNWCFCCRFEQILLGWERMSLVLSQSDQNWPSLKSRKFY